MKSMLYEVFFSFCMYFLGGLQCVGHSFAYVALEVERYLDLNPGSYTVASRRATNLATHLPETTFFASCVKLSSSWTVNWPFEVIFHAFWNCVPLTALGIVYWHILHQNITLGHCASAELNFTYVKNLLLVYLIFFKQTKDKQWEMRITMYTRKNSCKLGWNPGMSCIFFHIGRAVTIIILWLRL